MTTTRSARRAAQPRQPSGSLKRLLSWLRHHPLAMGLVAVAVLTLTASACQNAQGRADNTAPPAAVPTFADCPTAPCPTPGEDAGTDRKGGDSEGAGNTETGTLLAQTPPPAPLETPVHRPGSGPRAWPLVKTGAKGESVAAIQLLLTAHGYRTDVDAVFGPATTSHLISYQRDRSVAADGIVGPDSWHALIINVRTGDKGPAVQAVQRLLTANSHSLTVDGVFGQGTAQAVTAFQTEHQLTADGIVGPDTWSALANLT
ncbi:peptidoglycan hydrolase-like protein with peptidoglycan-binding domain [Streptomyces sp. Ag109_G2-6]|uniref:peptidoglycan-binding domain-containing protein n=1 Tax=Streptomyces TaxID=1883 RepID=UPI0009A4AF92|nr:MULTISPECIES: peptidoglycan-binding protein [Streptomyces]RPF30153.1 peptidoglycan hydrolase-like protein with peptidoglycan-binding domain [Streptomyces sp. Ag109_G2-6]